MLSSKVPGTITHDGVRGNISAALAYTAAWIGGNGCIPLNYLMEDAATAEIARVQLWQWGHYNARRGTGETITAEFVDSLIKSIAPGIKKLVAGVKDADIQVAI